jgi:hypothetical protein
MFPVFGAVYVLLSHYLLCLFKWRRAQLTMATVAALIFIASDFPLFLARTTPDWFIWVRP